nr:zinc finger protein 76-like isoform X1 [Procambarus clarkii]XP_045618521.1 zinc finger protein 76-like isoform X1 [Procambarus clarkii]XP_045618522.1 zinc finger protein 76-like isoform X1 [Procambarus clarkii]XP_045618523.1 zinc finger protein 76-like isoform X1 [Procambarus clarkii]
MNRSIVTMSHHIKEEVVEFMDDGSEHASVVVVEEGGGAVTLELPDGTQAIVHNAITDEAQDDMEGVAIQLDDGRIGYLYGDTLLQAVSDDQDQPLPNNSGKFLCCFPDCEKSYSSLHHLKTHQRNHTGQRPHACDVCKKCFTTGYALKSHLRTHTGEKPYQCPEEQCGKCFKTSGDLQKHVRTHTGERPFKCGMCDKSFTTSNIRKVHMRVHTGEKPYECKYDGCGRKFASATNYRNHCRIHTGEKPYVCSVENCGKRFTEYSSLYKHHMVHNQQKKYFCTQCGRFYRQLSTFAVHKRTVHNIIENDDGQVLWMGGGLEMDLLAEDQDGTVVNSHIASASTSANTRTVHISPGMVIKKEEQIISDNILDTQLTIEEECIRMPSVEVSNLIAEDPPSDSFIQDDRGSTLTNLELDGNESGSIFVFTDPSQLAALQQLAVASGAAGGGDENVGDTVEVIRLDDFTSVAESTITEGLLDTVNTKQNICESNGKIIVIEEVNIKEEKMCNH